MEEPVQMIETLYSQGNYSSCEQLCNDLNEQCRTCKLNMRDYGIDEQVFPCVMEDNILVLKSLMWIRDNGSHESWNEIMQNFIQLNREYTSLYALNSIPLKYYLNAVHNALWWGWWCPYGFETERLHIETCIHVSSDCFRKVLEHCGSEYISSCFSDSEDDVAHLMKEAADSLFKFRRDVTLQLIDIFILTLLMLLELEHGREIYVKCIDIASSVLSKRNRVLMLTPSYEKEWRCNLKLGLIHINSTVERTDSEVSFILLNVCRCAFYIKTQQYAQCVDCLQTSQSTDVHLSSVENYMKVFACYMSHDLETSLLFLSTVEKMAVSSRKTVKCHLLSGLVLSKAGRHNDALLELFKALHKDCREMVTVTLYCIAKEYQTLYEACPPGSLVSTLQAAHIDTLRHLVQVLKDKQGNMHSFSSFCIKSRILNIVHHQPAISLSKAMYFLGTALAKSGNVSAACQVYVEMLALPDVLPHASVTHHDATALLLKCNRLEEAETLCRQAVSCYVPQNHGLLSLEDDVVALMMLAHIYKLKAQYNHQADTLDRCLRIISNYKRQKLLLDGSETVDVINLLNVLSAKLHAEKANNYLKRSSSFRRDALYELKQAVLCNPDDKDILNSYKLLMEGMPHEKTIYRLKLSLPSEDCSEIALMYLIESYSTQHYT